MPNLLPYIAASLVGAINGAILATVGLESLGLGADNVHTLGTTIYWARRYSAILRGQWWWWGPPIALISLIFIGLFLLSMGLDRIANPTLSALPWWRRRRRARRAIPQKPQPQPALFTKNGASDMAPVLAVDDLRVVFETTAGIGAAVDGVSFTLKPGERMGLIGESGCGKTTMASALMSMVRSPGYIDGGSIVLGGEDLLALRAPEMRRRRLKEVALMPQAAMNSLNPVMRIRDQVTDAILAHEPQRTQQELETMVTTALEKVGLPANVANRFPHQLSGGMKQRATMAIATVLQPKLIIADEPTSALDVVVQRQVMMTLARVQEDLGAATILIGHDMGLIAHLSDSIGVLYAGQLVERGEIDVVLDGPRHPYTRLLVESLPDLEMRKEFVDILVCHRPSSIGLPAAVFIHAVRLRLNAVGVKNRRFQVVAGRQVACHLYPEKQELPPCRAPLSLPAAMHLSAKMDTTIRQLRCSHEHAFLEVQEAVKVFRGGPLWRREQTVAVDHVSFALQQCRAVDHRHCGREWQRQDDIGVDAHGQFAAR
ncbi:MAG: ATP-binding cassette domain-containing protein [Caldilineaceae bacterium]